MTRRDARRILRNGTITAQLLDLDRPVRPSDPVVLEYLDERLTALLAHLGLVEQPLPNAGSGVVVPPLQTRKFPLIEAVNGAILAHGLGSARLKVVAFDRRNRVDEWVDVIPLEDEQGNQNIDLVVLTLPQDGRKWTGYLYITAYYDGSDEDPLPNFNEVSDAFV